jgi:hypothetical protein
MKVQILKGHRCGAKCSGREHSYEVLDGDYYCRVKLGGKVRTLDEAW